MERSRRRTRGGGWFVCKPSFFFLGRYIYISLSFWDDEVPPSFSSLGNRGSFFCTYFLAMNLLFILSPPFLGKGGKKTKNFYPSSLGPSFFIKKNLKKILAIYFPKIRIIIIIWGLRDCNLVGDDGLKK